MPYYLLARRSIENYNIAPVIISRGYPSYEVREKLKSLATPETYYRLTDGFEIIYVHRDDKNTASTHPPALRGARGSIYVFRPALLVEVSCSIIEMAVHYGIRRSKQLPNLDKMRPCCAAAVLQAQEKRHVYDVSSMSAIVIISNKNNEFIQLLDQKKSIRITTLYESREPDPVSPRHFVIFGHHATRKKALEIFRGMTTALTLAAVVD